MNLWIGSSSSSSSSSSSNILLCGLILILKTVLTASVITYDGFKIYEIYPENQVQSAFLNELAAQHYEEIDFFILTKIPNVAARAMVTPQFHLNFERALTRNAISYEILHTNVAKSLAPARREQKQMRSLVSVSGFTQFHRFDEINDWMKALATTHPDRVSIQKVGKSFEGRSISTITITNGDGYNGKNVIFIDAGIHAREWIAPATALYIIHQLVENFEQNQNLLKDYDWIVLPVVNPDGYEYTHTDSRFWRKTRKPGPTTCLGTDGNRNFGFHWGEGGASVSSCSDTYRGPKAFSEPETQIVRDVLQSIADRAQMYLSLHSYGKYILYPWGYTNELPRNVEDLEEVARAGAENLTKLANSNYTVGSAANVMYIGSGGSDDYALGQVKIPIALTMELQAGGTGYDPDPTEIKPMVEENWIGITAMAQKVQQKYPKLTVS